MSPRAAALLEAFGFQDVADYVVGKADWLARGLPVVRDDDEPTVAGMLAVDAPLIDPTMTAGDAAALIDHADTGVGLVAGPGGTVLGLLTREDVSQETDQPVEALMELGPSTFRADADLDGPLDYMDRHDVDQVVITDPDGSFIGVMLRADVRAAMES